MELIAKQKLNKNENNMMGDFLGAKYKSTNDYHFDLRMIFESHYLLFLRIRQKNSQFLRITLQQFILHHGTFNKSFFFLSIIVLMCIYTKNNNIRPPPPKKNQKKIGGLNLLKYTMIIFLIKLNFVWRILFCKLIRICF